MSQLVVGVSHHSAPIEVLERCALSPRAARALAARLVASEHVHEALVLATCNRLEVYADVVGFHAGLTEIAEALAAATGVALTDLSSQLFAHHGEACVRHLFTVACGMDSMALGESQVLGQVRDALRNAQHDHTVGRVLSPLFQQALRVGKRAFTETGLARSGHSLVEQGLLHAEPLGLELRRSSCLVVGAGAMSGLATATLARHDARSIVIANRSPHRAERLADSVGGRWVALTDESLVAALAEADVVITCTGAVGHVLTADLVEAGRGRRPATPQLIVDLALPRDVEPRVAELPGVRVVGLAELGAELAGLGVGTDVEAVTTIVQAEVARYLQSVAAGEVAPTVVALRAYAEELLQSELVRLRARLNGHVDDRVAAEVERTLHRVVEKILHRPTVRVKSLSTQADGALYAAALRALFDLDLDDRTGEPPVTDVTEALAANADLLLLLGESPVTGLGGR